MIARAANQPAFFTAGWGYGREGGGFIVVTSANQPAFCIAG